MQMEIFEIAIRLFFRWYDERCGKGKGIGIGIGIGLNQTSILIFTISNKKPPLIKVVFQY